MMAWVRVCPVSKLPVEGRQVVEIEGEEVLVVRTARGIFAVENRCSHAGVALAEGPVEEETIVCPLHRARFSLASGEALSPPAYEGIATFPVRVEGEWVWVGSVRAQESSEEEAVG
ncbi:MAG: non-heme iron oxygenase ferredoxin subunit [Hydrogenophilus sp.]|nr:non-heme iron oxygenase ferredoxin subunit [Hydrogenophilus sp.]